MIIKPYHYRFLVGLASTFHRNERKSCMWETHTFQHLNKLLRRVGTMNEDDIKNLPTEEDFYNFLDRFTSAYDEASVDACKVWSWETYVEAKIMLLEHENEMRSMSRGVRSDTQAHQGSAWSKWCGLLSKIYFKAK